MHTLLVYRLSVDAPKIYCNNKCDCRIAPSFQ